MKYKHYISNYNYIKFPKINPIIFSIGNINIYWYGIMYLLSFLFAIYIGKRYFLKYKIKKNDVENILSICFIGVIIGGRVGYVLFYDIFEFLKNPLYIFKIWNGGMSFHGGLIGVLISLKMLSSTKKKYSFYQLSDFISTLTPIGLGLGRIGNFINGELWGRVSVNTPWSFLFPQSKYRDLLISSNKPELLEIINKYGNLPRHPSQIYEIILEGIILFIIIKLYAKKQRSEGKISGLFLITYGSFRVFVEFFREPDFYFELFYIISIGQMLSIPMIIYGIILINKFKKQKT